MVSKREVALWPFKIGLQPIVKIGEAALRLASSSAVGEQREQEAAQELERNNFETAIALAHELQGRLTDESLLIDEEQRSRVQNQLDETAKDLGYRVIAASSDFVYANSLHIPAVERPVLES
ncbi:MAG TPA: hypothetical protein VLG13_03125 [Patescibacteria group bacterium]|nr:hypothetical protein [Patescibacteria group bacterium]